MSRQDGSSIDITPTTTPTSFAPSGIRPTNFTRIHRPEHEISGTFVIDRGLRLPCPDGSYNLHLATTKNLTANVYILPPSSSATQEDKGTATSLVFSGVNVSVEIHRSGSVGDDYPLNIQIRFEKAATISLPRSFNGPLQLCTSGNFITFHRDLEPNFLLFSEVDGKTNGFIGEIDYSQLEDFDNVAGDKINTLSWGSEQRRITLRYDDDKLKTQSRSTRVRMY
ncbi:hypothetical protein CPB83DRAFT_852335 [Crepidotus variabilis]|uniref:DUF7330 domain-containing protein n=1 Tax=Crepidotus variabilis TaxID=179855 RepID=A0A9P6EIH4_9AGAR|nr:hypothetical protein CPB83DRAFT_852335 [Crepidotus variabilis]